MISILNDALVIIISLSSIFKGFEKLIRKGKATADQISDPSNNWNIDEIGQNNGGRHGIISFMHFLFFIMYLHIFT